MNNGPQQIPSSGSKDQVTGEEPRTYGDKLRDLANFADTLSKLTKFVVHPTLYKYS